MTKLITISIKKKHEEAYKKLQDIAETEQLGISEIICDLIYRFTSSLPMRKIENKELRERFKA